MKLQNIGYFFIIALALYFSQPAKSASPLLRGSVQQGNAASAVEHEALSGTSQSPLPSLQQQSPQYNATSQQIGDIGIRVGYQGVIYVYPNSPAAYADIHFADIISGINGRYATGLSDFQLTQLIQGPPGTTVEISLVRNGQSMVKRLVRVPIQAYASAASIASISGTDKQTLIATQLSGRANNTMLYSTIDKNTSSGTPGIPQPQASIQGTTYGGQESRVLSWDEWYRRLSQIDDALMVQALANHHNPVGVAHLRVTVTPNHHLSAQLQDTTHRIFGQAALEGVQALDGNPALEYPAGSRRGTFSFRWTANHQGQSGRAPDTIIPSTIMGDRERQYRQW